MTEDRERDEEPRVRITDRRRFANLRDAAPADPAGADAGPATEGRT